MNIDRYKVDRLLGQGAMGKVYLATDPKIDRQVAVKVLSTGNNDADLRRRFRLEAKAIAALKHPNIVELYDYSGKDAGDLFLVMEYVPGLSLYRIIADQGRMSEATALCIGHELSLALEHAHEKQVVHRDLKPENVMLHQGRVVLTDFGVVKAIASDNALGVKTVATRTQVLGTPGFMAPEQFTGERIDARTDIFCLGAVLYNLVTGQLPFDGKSIDEIFRRLKKGKFKDPREYNPLITPGFCELLGKCMTPKAKGRIASANEVKERILSLLALHGVTEIRQELVSYEKNPAGYVVEQRERALDVLVRDLKVALKDRRLSKARVLIGRIQKLAPAEERVREITGVSFDADRRPIFSTRTLRKKHVRWFVIGLVLGGLVGVVAGVAVMYLKLVPAAWFDALVRLVR